MPFSNPADEKFLNTSEKQHFIASITILQAINNNLYLKAISNQFTSGCSPVPELSFLPAPHIWGGKKGEFRDWTTAGAEFESSNEAFEYV